jgi:hypothetical protein
MNTLMLVVLAVVALCYCGGRYCPKILSSNKELFLGVLVGMALCSFAGLRLEGMIAPRNIDDLPSICCTEPDSEECIDFNYSSDIIRDKCIELGF